MCITCLVHHSTTYVDAAYCYGQSSMVCHDREPYKNRRTDQDAVWLWTQVGPRNHILDWGPDPQCKRAILRGKWWPIVKYSSLCCELYENEMPFGMWTWLRALN